MKPVFPHIICALVISFLCSCGVNRYLPSGELLYTGATIKIEKATGVKKRTSFFEKKLVPMATPKPNKKLFGKPYKVWWWYIIGPSKKEKGFKPWLRNTLGDPPVLLQDLSPDVNAEKMQALLENEGYFNSKLHVDSLINKNNIRLSYLVKIERPYFLGPVTWRLDSSQMAKAIIELTKQGSLLKTGEQYNEQKIKSEKERLVQLLKGKGYYYFEPEHLLAYIDTNHNNYTAAVFMALNNPVPAAVRMPYTINQIVVRTPFTTFQPLADSIVQTFPQHDGIYIYDSTRKFKPEVFAQSITFRKGSLYSLPQQSRTQARINSLGVFRFIKPQFTKTAAGADLLDVTYFMAPYKRRKLQTDIGGFTRSNSYSGGQLSVQWADKNFFKRAASLVLKGTGSFELTTNDSLQDNNNWRVGLEATLNLPKLLVPFPAGRRLVYFPKTSFPVSFDWVRHEALYTEKYFHFRYELSWRDSVRREYRFSPFGLTITNTANFTNTFELRQAIDSSLDYTLPTLIIPALGFQYIVTNVAAGKKHSTHLSAGIELAGNILGLVKGNHGYFSTKVANAYFSQFVKAGIDFRYYLKIGAENSWANRIIIGASYPYGNSPFLPFSRQYIIGGASSLRGFQPRQLGPGSAQATEMQQSTFPQIGGDYKLEVNTELRTTLAGRLKGAVFIDAGNIWMKDSILYTPAGQLTKDFYKQIAIDAGVGLRVDISLLVIRLDLAMPFYKPWLSEGQRWTFNAIAFRDKDWRNENLIWNFALGFPF